MEIERYVLYQRQQIERRGAERAKLAQEVAQRLPALVTALAGLGATRILLFGSLANGTFREDSDVDIAVSELPSGALIDAVAEASRVMGRSVDVIRIETAGPRLRDRIETEGRELRGE